MKYLNLNLRVIMLALIPIFYSCNERADTGQVSAEETPIVQEVPLAEKAKNMTVYEVNIRQYTPEGTFNAFSTHLPKLKELGIELLWIMPIHPVGEKNRKGTLGSYYSVKDYRAVNPEFGTLDDFKKLLEEAHKLGMYVILDWVPNHTSWDNAWITEHPEYYAQDEQGNVVYEADWTDIALLNHHNPETRRAMIDAMEYWVTETDIDGFRCDHAGHEIPLYFWEESMGRLNAHRDLFWLAEWDEPRMHLEFDATYNWELHHITNRVAKGENNVEDIRNYIQHDLDRYGLKAYRLNFATNHDENSWSGTVFERYGEGHKANALLMFTINGLPMIYSGQEAGMKKRLQFFEKDTINWTDPDNVRDFYTKLVRLRKENKALWSGDFGGMIKFIDTGNDRVIAFYREKGDNKVTVVINLDGKGQQVVINKNLAGIHAEYFSETQVEWTVGSSVAVTPLQYFVFIE